MQLDGAGIVSRLNTEPVYAGTLRGSRLVALEHSDGTRK